MSKFDNIFLIIGDFERYQKRNYLLLCLPAIGCAMHMLSWVFLGAKLDHRCRLPIENDQADYNNLPPNILFNMTFPYFKKGSEKIDPCNRLDVDFENENYFLNGIPSNRIKSCEGNYVFDYSTYQSSARIDFNMICDKEYLYTQTQTIFMIGMLFGSLLFGHLSDRFGRRPIFFLCISLQSVFGIFAGFATNYWMFALARMIIGACATATFMTSVVIAMELVGPSKRTFVGVVVELFFTAGYLITAVLAYYIKNWKTLQLALSIPGVLFYSYYWILPESIRWLLARGKREEARAILRKVAAENKVNLSEETLIGLTEDDSNVGKEETKSANFFDILHYKRLLLRTLNLFLGWFVISGVYYGLSLNTSNLGGNDYLNFALAGVVEIPAYLFLLVTLNKAGRKCILSGCMLAGGVFMCGCAFVPEGWTGLLITFAMIGKMCISGAYATIYVYSAESLPTVIRNSGVGVSSMFARVGGVVANNLLVLGKFWKPLPLILFGVATLVSGLLFLTIPETLGRRLPDTMEDGEKFGTPGYDNINVEMMRKNGIEQEKPRNP